VQVSTVDHGQSLLSILPEFGLVQEVDALICLGVPEKPLPTPGSTMSTKQTCESLAVPEEGSKTPPDYNHAYKRDAIAAVKACLPDEEEKHIAACLASMDWNSERVVDAFLMNKLPAHLQRKKQPTREEKQLVYAPGRPPPLLSFIGILL
jgi:hypothetical protein